MAELDLIAQMDQMGASMETLGGVAGQYYRALVASGVPPAEAGVLLRDWHWLNWWKIHFPMLPPEPLHA